MTTVWDPISDIISTSKDIVEIYAALLHALSMIIAVREDIQKLQKMPSKKCNEWIRQVIKTEEEVEQLRSRYDKLNHRSSLFFALQLKSIIKEMKIKGMIVIKLLEAGQFLEESKHLQVFVAPPPSPPESVIKRRATDITKFPNLQASLKDTLKLLEDERVRGIRIVGMVGIGKSSILRNLNNHVQVAKTFDIVLWIKVFSTKTGEEKLSIQQLQKAIGKRLKVDVTGFNNFDSISQAISKELDGKKYLLLLDDFQYDLDIYQTGVPDCNNGSKIVLTTNWRHFCSRIVDQVVRVSYLSDHESWMMFQHLLNLPELDQALVRRIVGECGGHQLLIGAMANILRTKGDVNWWTEGEGFNNLRRLSKKEHSGVKEFYGELYRLIKYCFSGLEEGQRKCFLYAALYPLGCPIYVDSLLECWEAEDFLGGTTGHLVLEHLKNKLLLEEGEDPKLVTMHKCMRQVALYVAYDDPECKYLVSNGWKLPGKSNKQWRDKNWISLGNIKSEMLPDCPDSGKLSTLFLQKNMDLDCIPPTFFKNMKSLKVLDFCQTGIRCLPPSFSYLVSLKVLYLSYCTSLFTLPPDIEKLKCLEVLDIRGSGVKNLPSYIKKLKGLRRLRISFFSSEKENEAAGASFDCAVISELHLLEELVIDVESPQKWSNQVVGHIIEVAATLKKLVCLQFSFSNDVVDVIKVLASSISVHVPDINIFHTFIKETSSWRKIQFFQAFIGCEISKQPHIHEFSQYRRYVMLCDCHSIGAGQVNNIQSFFEVLASIEAFELVNCNDIKKLSDLSIPSLGQMRGFLIESCSGLETALENVIAPNLEHLYLKNLAKLHTIWSDQVGAVRVTQLKTLVLTGCQVLRNIFPFGVIQQLREIEYLKVEDCPEIVEVVKYPESAGKMELLPKLRKLTLLQLPKLESVFANEEFKCPAIEKLEVRNCPALRKLPFSKDDLKKLKYVKAENPWADAWQCDSSEDEPSSSLQKSIHEHSMYQFEEELSNIEYIGCSDYSHWNVNVDAHPKDQLEGYRDNFVDIGFGDSPVHERLKHHLEGEHTSLKDLGYIDLPGKEKVHDHPKHWWEGEPSNIEDLGSQNSALDYSYQDEGCSTVLSGLYGKEESTTTSTTSEELEEVPSNSTPQMDLIETIARNASCIHTLDLSYTNIKYLPEFISKFVALRIFNLKGCQLLTEIVPEIGDLINLEEFDLEGTEIICLPKEISKLINLRSLKFSLCSYADQFQETKRIGSIIPRKALSNLVKLNELCIDVHPDGDWWNKEVRGVVDDLCCLKELNTLRLSMPTVDLLDNLIQHLMRLVYGTAPTFRFDLLDNLVRRFMPSTSGTAPQFRLTVGRHEECLVSRLPKDVIEEFHNLEKFEKGLKYINSEGIPIEVKNALKHVDALFLERHWSINNLLEFGLENIDELRFCILLECNELQAVIDAKQSKDFDQRILGSLQHLSIHYMKKMKRIWRGPVTKGSLFNLKSLALHTCISLTTVFTLDMLVNLVNLEDVRIEDCPKIKTLVSLKSPKLISRHFLPNLKRMLLLELPNLGCISSGLLIAPKLERIVIFYCSKLDKLSSAEICSSDLKVIKGDTEWWDALKWHESDMTEDKQNYLASKFIPLREDGNLEEQFLIDEIT